MDFEKRKDQLGRKLEEIFKDSGKTPYRMRKAVQRTKNLPPPNVVEGVFKNDRDYSFETLLRICDELQVDIQFIHRGRPLLPRVKYDETVGLRRID